MHIIWILVTIPMIVGICLVEFLLLRINNKLGLLIPVFSVVSIIPLGIIGIILTVLTFLIYFIQSYVWDKKRRRQKEVEKTRINDL
ncbi:hypothetical protein GCM10011351_08540 [Paraliobacillus quinghaiensis]|uniref:Uncharacterized protein n=1 Tax=Paraliobacillus quinghaiensis TaxID=470815 RepID=A0A917WRE4_9BACI|nr:hypothetical protein [Paraliobacillus quinghaiensis]GGM25163.1 hypothetical protein GCM10011351_08540 [Paraliobacillus quinghaiensis]